MAYIPVCRDCGYRHEGICSLTAARQKIAELQARNAELLVALEMARTYIRGGHRKLCDGAADRCVACQDEQTIVAAIAAAEKEEK